MLLYGDLILIQIGELFRNWNVKKQNRIFRWAGDEFLMMLSDTTMESALETANYLVNLVKDKNLASIYSESNTSLCTMSAAVFSDFLRSHQHFLIKIELAYDAIWEAKQPQGKFTHKSNSKVALVN